MWRRKDNDPKLLKILHKIEFASGTLNEIQRSLLVPLWGHVKKDVLPNSIAGFPHNFNIGPPIVEEQCGSVTFEVVPKRAYICPISGNKRCMERFFIRFDPFVQRVVVFRKMMGRGEKVMQTFPPKYWRELKDYQVPAWGEVNQRFVTMLKIMRDLQKVTGDINKFKLFRPLKFDPRLPELLDTGGKEHDEEEGEEEVDGSREDLKQDLFSRLCERALAKFPGIDGDVGEGSKRRPLDSTAGG